MLTVFVRKQILYEFYGCVYHGCPLCYDERNDYPFKRKKMKDFYRETLEHEERIRALGLVFVQFSNMTFKNYVKQRK